MIKNQRPWIEATKVFTALVLAVSALLSSGCGKKGGDDMLDLLNQISILNTLSNNNSGNPNTFPANFTCMIGGRSYVYVNRSMTDWVQSIRIETASSTISTVYDLLYANNTWHVAGQNGVAYSTAGNNWTMTGITGINLREIDYSGTKLIAGGLAVALTTSTDGISWSNFTPGTVTGNNIFGLAYGNSTWVIGGNLQAPSFLSPLNYSNDDGATWLDSDLPAGTSVVKIIHANNLFVALRTGGSVATSANGINWTVRTSPTTNELSSIAYGNGTYVAVGASGTVIYSTDGVNWQLGTSGETANISSVAYDASSMKFLALSQRPNACNCGSTTHIAILSSSNGSTWTVELENSTTFDGQYANVISCKP